MAFKQLQDLLDAYRRTIGAPYGGWRTADVLKLFDHFARTPQTWQRELCDATGVSSSKVNRFIDVAEEHGWIERPTSRTPDAKKPLELTAAGRQVIGEFKRLGRKAAADNRRTARQHTAGRRTGKRSGPGPVAGSKSQNLWEVLGDVVNPGETGTVDEPTAAVPGSHPQRGDDSGKGE